MQYCVFNFETSKRGIFIAACSCLDLTVKVKCLPKIFIALKIEHSNKRRKNLAFSWDLYLFIYFLTNLAVSQSGTP
jgi:hypothetical protein